jgi:hypothetical protein
MPNGYAKRARDAVRQTRCKVMEDSIETPRQDAYTCQPYVDYVAAAGEEGMLTWMTMMDDDNCLSCQKIRPALAWLKQSIWKM